MIATYRYSSVNISDWKFYRRKLTKHKIWIRMDHKHSYKWIPLNPSFYTKSDTTSGTYIINPIETFNHYKECNRSEHILRMLDTYREIYVLGRFEVSELCESSFDSEYMLSYDIERDIYVINNRENRVDELLEA